MQSNLILLVVFSKDESFSAKGNGLKHDLKPSHLRIKIFRLMLMLEKTIVVMSISFQRISFTAYIPAINGSIINTIFETQVKQIDG